MSREAHVRFCEGVGVKFPCATHLVVLCRYNVHKTFDKVTETLKSLGLTLNTEKTRVLDATQEGFTFLGFTAQIKTSPLSGKRFPLIAPSKKAISHIKKEIKDLTCRRNLALPKEVVIDRINETVRGWVNYFYYGNCSKSFVHIRNYAEERVR